MTNIIIIVLKLCVRPANHWQFDIHTLLSYRKGRQEYRLTALGFICPVRTIGVAIAY